MNKLLNINLNSKQYVSLKKIKEEIAQMAIMKRLTQEEVYHIINESGFPEYIYKICNNAELDQ